ncbi:MATE family efflux transporter [Agarivorans sp. DSG3-1]|uniref:MATE family efflux transporter n=1 Tax=Agarivorans sp. DSG3-1 TaxID=3342249 RepID=UPI00398E916B
MPSTTQSKTLQKGLFGMALPIFGEFMLNMSVPVFDALFLSQVSDQAAASVGAVMPWFSMAIVFFSATGIAGASLASQYMGKQNYLRANLMLAGLLILGVLAGLLCGLFFVTQANNIGHWMSLPLAMSDLAAEYLVLAGAGVGFMGLRMTLANICNSYGQSHWNTISAALMLVTNIVGNGILVLGWFGVSPMGVTGVAIASLIAWVLSLSFSLVVVLFLIKVKLPLADALKQPSLSLKPILKIAVPSALEPFSYQSFVMIMNLMIVQLGETSLTVRIYALNIYVYCTMMLVALGIANTMLVTQLAGAGHFERCHQQMRQGLRWGLIAVSIVATIIFVFHQPLLGIFTDNPEVLALGLVVCLIHSINEPLRGINIISGNVLRGCGDAVFVTGNAIAVTWLFSVPLAYFTGIYLGWGLYAILLAGVADEFIRSQINWRRWKSDKWKRKLAPD